MQFLYNKPYLKVIITDLKESKIYFQPRLDYAIDVLKKTYQITVEHSKHYLGLKLSQCIIFEHENKFFKVIDLSDPDNSKHAGFFNIVKDNRCQFVLKSQYNPKLNIPKLRPFFYFEKSDPKFFCENLNFLRSIKKVNNKLYWRGVLHDNRKKIILPIKNILNDNFSKSLHFKAYYEELATYSVALSLPGGGNSCHREFECFGIGTVVLSPKFKNIYHIPLIPNYHYICVDGDGEKEIIKNIRKRFSRLTSDEIEFVKKNAMEYYDNNIRYKKSVDWIVFCLEL